MADINLYIPIVEQWEGKLGTFTNDPADMGGATNAGITLNTYISYCEHKSLPIPSVNDLKNLNYDTWLDILKTMYWDKWCGDNLTNQSVANFLVDWLFNSGEYGILIPQRILFLVQDGIVGAKTIAAVNSTPQQAFHDQLRMQRTLFVNNIAVKNPLEEKFENGWHNRINSFTFQP